MSAALPGQHYCVNHQGNHSHYAEHNCIVCQLLAALRICEEALGSDNPEVYLPAVEAACAALAKAGILEICGGIDHEHS